MRFSYPDVSILPIKREALVSRVVRAREGSAADRDDVILSVLPYVIKIARRSEGYGLDLDDLVHEGVIGVMTAIKKYDETRHNPKTGLPYTFLTYATPWIRVSMQRAIQERGKLVRLPAHAHAVLRNRRRVRLSLEEVLQQRLTEDEVTEALEARGEAAVPHRGMNPARLEQVFTHPVSVYPFSDDRSREVALQDLRQDRAEDECRQDERTLVLLAVGTLDSRLRRLIELRFGLFGEREHTLAEVGMKFRPWIGRERVRQLESRALELLRRFLEGREEVDHAARH